MSAADTLRKAAGLIEQRGEAASACWSAYGTDEHDTAWLDLMSPQVAGPLAAWLRAEAESDDNPMCVVVEGATPPLVARVPAMATPYALAMARAILGEPT
jgi:hypothetical protein